MRVGPGCEYAPHRAGFGLLALSLLFAPLAAGAAPPALEPPRCPEGTALVSGPPAPELFDPHIPQAGRAHWCERYLGAGRIVREGLYTDRHPSGAPRSRSLFVADRLEGELIMLHENGRVWMHTHYRRGRLHGSHVLFSPSGAPWLSAEYVDGRPAGLHTLYFETGGKSAETRYRDGVEEGTARAWYADGTPRYEISVSSGVWSGPFRRWHPNGELESEGRYARCPEDARAESCEQLGAARHGHWISRHPNGAPSSEGEWHYGAKSGTWRSWNPEGELLATQVYAGGRPVGASDDSADRAAADDSARAASRGNQLQPAATDASKSLMSISRP